jgi:TonB family protein
MRHLIIYAIESSICLALFMAFYHLLLKSDTRHGRNRFFLLFSLFASLLMPLLNIQIQAFGSGLLMKSVAEVNLPEIKVLSSQSGMGDSTGIRAFSLVYVAGIIITSVSFLISLSGILLLILTRPADGRIVKISSRKHACFSAFGYIFISSSVSPSDAERMIAHELTHIRKNHFADLIIVTVAGILQWFNPAVYALRKSLQAIHEYEADEECLNDGEDIASYQSLLVASAFSTNIPILTNKFSNKSLLKKRIIMMTKKKTGSLSSIKLLLALPLAALMFFTFSCNKSGEKKETSVVLKSEVANSNDDIFTVAEQMPLFPGGDDALIKFISENIKYPKTAMENKIQGKVIVRFCVRKDGKVDLFSVLRSADPSLSEEALRVVKLLPQFEPGKQGGKNVDVWYTLPINFALK